MEPSRHGLSNQDAFSRLERFGANELPTVRPRTFIHILFDVLREPMVFLLLAGGGIYFALGDRHEALSLIGFLGLIVAITLYQERKTENALGALRDLSSPRATVIRNGIRIVIPGKEVVPGDLMVVSEGNQVAADGELISAAHLATDESLLTGESNSVDKRIRSEVPTRQNALLSESEVYAGSMVVRGEGLARVTATGLRTKLGEIGVSLQNVSQEKSRLQVETRKLVRNLALIATGLCLLVVATYTVTRHDLLGGFLAGITLAMAILPNEIPAVLLIFLATGAWRLSRRRVLTRRIPAVEALGSATVLCVDKTGTLTLNLMSIGAAWVDGSVCQLDQLGANELPENFHEIFEFGILASRPDPFDPMEKAFHSAGARFLMGTEHLHRDWSLLREYPLTDSLLAVSYAWRSKPSGGSTIAAKGAPEAIVDLCHLPSGQAEHIENAAQELAQSGYRVLAVAKSHSEKSLPTEQHDLDFIFIGLIGLIDPIRPDVPQAIEECTRAGVRVVMITGDHPETAKNIAKQIGLSNPNEILTGPEILTFSDLELKGRLTSVNICARTLPEQKLRIVTLLKELGEVVAMTGDGVNDAPALKAADIGIAMGRRGTDVAREAASLVLLEDDFSSIVAAIRMGRRIFANLRHALSYLLSVHVPITVLTILPVALNLPLVLLPIHIAFLHLVIEPACTFVFEAELESNSVMRQPPRDPNEPLFPAKSLQKSVLRGAWVALILLGVYFISLWRGQREDDSRALTFTSLMLSNLGLILANLSQEKRITWNCAATNKALRMVTATSFVLLAVVLYVPDVRTLFRFSHLHPIDLVICAAAGAVSVIGTRILKHGS